MSISSLDLKLLSKPAFNALTNQGPQVAVLIWVHSEIKKTCRL